MFEYHRCIFLIFDQTMMAQEQKYLIRDQLSNSLVKMLLLTGNIWKAYKVRNLFRLGDRRKSRIF